MRVSYQWLSELVADLPPVADLARALTMGGLEVESIQTPPLAYGDKLVVAHLTSVAQHPNADRLTLCRVDDGSGVRDVVCGAKNHKTGDTVVLARPGCELPGGVHIKAAKLRGVESQGMLCSAAELRIAQDGEGILILEPGLNAGTPAAPLLGLEDTILEVAITPNRGDCLCMRGIAREVAALCGTTLRSLPAGDTGAGAPSTTVAITIEDRDRCALYRGGVIRSVSVGLSPTWLRTRLAAAGLRSISNVVDVTNLVLLELGQPLHAFDLALLEGPEIRVRRARAGERLKTLDDRDIELDADDLVIADARRPVALAGVMGGAETAVTAATSSILLEAAAFDPGGVRRTARRHAMSTDSSYRFERGIDATSVEAALARATALLIELAGGVPEDRPCAAGVAPTSGPTIDLRAARVEQVLGVPVPESEIRRVLTSLGCTVAGSDSAMVVTVPGHRTDLLREIDLVEEVARVRGYDEIPAALPRMPMMPVRLSPIERARRDMRTLLVSCGLSEHLAMTFATSADNERFPGLHQASESVRLLNPVRAGEDELRRSVLSSLASAIAVNAAAGQSRIDLFCIGAGFARSDDGAALQAGGVGLVLCGPRPGRGPGAADALAFGDIKGLTEKLLGLLAPHGRVRFVATSARQEYHPRSCAALLVDGAAVGHLGKLHPDIAEGLEITEEIFLAEIDYPRVVEYSPRHQGLRPIPRYPSSTRDVSLLVARQTPAGAAIEVVERLGDPSIESIVVFDEYSGAGIGQDEKALGYKIVYRSADRTLTDAEVSALHEKVVDVLIEQLRARVRS